MGYVLAFATCLSLSMLAQPALAAPPGGHEPGGHVDITQVAIDFDTEIIHDESIGDTVCTPDFTASPQRIEFDLSPVGLPAAGDYELEDGCD